MLLYVLYPVQEGTLRYLKILLISELLAIAALLIVSIMIGLGVYIESYLTFDPEVYNVYTPVEEGFLYFQIPLIFGLYFVVLFGAPVYSVLKLKGLANYWSSACVGLVPGIVLWFFSTYAGSFAVFSGGLTAIITHWFVSRYSLSR